MVKRSISKVTSSSGQAEADEPAKVLAHDGSGREQSGAASGRLPQRDVDTA
jgi:hypothetical protein